MASADTSLEETGTKAVLSGTNGEVSHVDPPENSEHSAQLKKEIPTENEVNSKEPNGSPEPKVKLSSEDYLEKFKLNILFEELIFRTLDNTPENPLKFLLTNLETMERENWEPGESKAEKSESVAKLFKIPDPESVLTGKSNPKATGRPGTGVATKGPANPKVGTSQVKTAVKTTPPRPGAASKVVSGKATPIRPTPAKAAQKTTATPAKTAAPSTAKAGTTGPARSATVGARTGVTGAAGKTGTSGTVAGAKPGTTVGKTGVKTGSNTAVNKPGASRPTSAPAPTKTAAKVPPAKAPPKSAAPRTISSGTRPTKGPVIPKTGAAQTKAKPPGAVAKATSPGADKATSPGADKATSPGADKATSPGADKSDKSEPVPKTPSPVEEAKAATPEEPIIPVDDGVCSKIQGSEYSTPKVLDSEEQIALEEAQDKSDDDDENINVVQKSPSLENMSNESPIELGEVVVTVDSQGDRYITSQDYANDIQAIEDDVVQNRQSDDEGIEVNLEPSNYPAVGLKTADELDNPGLYNLSLDPKGFSELTQANITIEVTDESGAKQHVDTTDEIQTEIPDLNEEDLVREKSHDLDQEVLITEPHDVITTPEDSEAHFETTQTDSREVKYSEDLGIDVEEQNSPKDSPVLEQALEPTTDQLITVDTDIQPDSTMDELKGMQAARSDVTQDILLTEANLDNPEELLESVQKEHDLLSGPIEKEHDLLSGPIEKEHDLLSGKESDIWIDPIPIEKENDLLSDLIRKERDLLSENESALSNAPIEKDSDPSIEPFQTGNDLLTNPFQTGNDLSTNPFQTGNDLMVDPMPQKSLLDSEQPNLSHSPDSDEAPQPLLEPEPEPIFPASTGDV